MNPRRAIIITLILIVWAVGPVMASPAVLGAAAATASTIAVPVPFIANQGQVDNEAVRYYARTFAGSLFVTAEADLVYALSGGASAEGAWAFREAFVGAGEAEVRGETPSAVTVSSFRGEAGAWRSKLATFDALDLGELYPGVRVRLRAAADNVEKLFHVAPGADVGSIAVAVEGVDALALDHDGRLVLATALGDVVFTAPVAFQDLAGRRHPVEVAYVLRDHGRYGFRVGDYDRDHELVIDPLLASTFLGGHNPNPPGNYDDDLILAMAVADDAVYVAGATQSPDFPVHLGYDGTLASASPDGFVARLSRDLSSVISATYLGTEGFDRVTDLALDDDGTVVVVGQAGWGFPVTDGAYTWSGTTPTGGGFVARLSADLSALVASAVVTPSDYPSDLALGNGGVYFGGTTTYPGFPITDGAFLSTCCPVSGSYGIRESDGFAGKVSADLTLLEAMTYLGGDRVSGLAVGDDGSVYVSDGFDYAVTGRLARLDAGLTARTALVSYYPGSTSGSSRAYFNDVAAGNGFVVAVGQTYMNDLPTTEGVYDPDCGTDGLCDGVGTLLVPRSDGFVAVYSPDLQSTIALTYLGGSDHESIRSVALGRHGEVLVTGETTSGDFPMVGGDCDRHDGDCDEAAGAPPLAAAEGFVARLSSDLSRLRYANYLGGAADDLPRVIAVADAAEVYVAGDTDSVDYPTTAGAFDATYNGGTADGFIAWLDTTGDDDDDDDEMIFADGFEGGGMLVWHAVMP